ncbi:MAG: hypothetical protein HZB55_19300 [Deltaproteobacteria bacterium]|nr:hypothetical protein [Deltaproteobacteria bacterium]
MDTHVQPRDVILVHIDGKPAFYGRVEEILFDAKKGWRRFRFQVLTLPPQEMVWTLEPVQIDGEPFTMGGTPVQIERLADPVPAEAPADPAPRPPGKVIVFPPRKGD